MKSHVGLVLVVLILSVIMIDADGWMSLPTAMKERIAYGGLLVVTWELAKMHVYHTIRMRRKQTVDLKQAA